MRDKRSAARRSLLGGAAAGSREAVGSGTTTGHAGHLAHATPRCVVR